MAWNFRKDALASSLSMEDATERHLDICHFHSSAMMTINLTHANKREIRVDARMAAELAWVLDHFARHHRLPEGDRTMVEEWSI